MVVGFLVGGLWWEIFVLEVWGERFLAWKFDLWIGILVISPIFFFQIIYYNSNFILLIKNI